MLLLYALFLASVVVLVLAAWAIARTVRRHSKGDANALEPYDADRDDHA